MKSNLNEYLTFPFPKTVIKAIFVWPFRAREPLVLSVKDSEIVEGWDALIKL